MKKLFVITLALAMILAMATTAFAAVTTIDELPYTDSKDVTVTYNAGAAGTTTYGVEITWGATAFTYNAADTGSWNPATHEYETSDQAEWASTPSSTISVANHSNAAVSVTIAYEANEDYTGDLEASVTGGEVATLAAWSSDQVATKTATLAITGTPDAAADAGTLGTVTITIAAVQ